MNLLLTNIKGLVQVREKSVGKIAGTQMAELPVLENAYLLIVDGKIEDYGSMNDERPHRFSMPVRSLDCSGKFVFPSWVDPHTHLVFAGSREKEFELRIKGATYEEIAAAGGGILNSAALLNQTSEDELLQSARRRLHEIISTGTGAVEIKSGYGLSLEGEIKMLRVIKKLKAESPIVIKSTFLGAHAVPLEFKNRREDYLSLLIGQMLPQIAGEKLADYIDVFCDKGFFTPEETDHILRAGAEYGLKARIHANELDYSRGIQVGVKNKALSVDHLEFTGKEEIEALLASDTMPVLLPSTAFFLRLPYPPAREMLKAGLPIALASDYNPGSSPSGNMNFVLSLACLYLRLLPEEAINAATLNSAYALELSETHGSITKGKTANLFITEEIPSYGFLPYSFGRSRVETIILNGEVWKGN